MQMREQIIGFAEQFRYEPVIENAEKLPKAKKFLMCGMGGSALVGDMLKTYDPALPLGSHKDYNLPAVDPGTLIIASSYSGNTEETISAYEAAMKGGHPVAAVATGGKLLELARENNVPYIKMPSTGIQPRMALGYSTLAILKLIGDEKALFEAHKVADLLKSADLEDEGKALAEKLKGHVPIIYASSRNHSVAYNWKIKFNETGKIPAFSNVFPELNHNEMTGFSARGGSAPGGDVHNEVKEFVEKFHFIFLKDDTDHPQIKKRMDVLEKLYNDRGLSTTSYVLKGKGFEKIFAALVMADWAAYHTAELYGLESEQVPMVEEFKKAISE